jgi:outer membrane lipoprotein SlyB
LRKPNFHNVSEHIIERVQLELLMEQKKNRIHPLVAGAAASVMLVSLAGVAAITGLLPSSRGDTAPAAPTVASAPAAAAPAAPAESQPQPAAAPVIASESASRSAPPKPATAQQPVTQVAQAPSICSSCGRVEAVQALKHEGQGSGIGIAAGAVLGGVLGHQVGGGNGRKLATVAGAVGGGYAGNEVEKHARSTVSYSVRVRMEDGRTRTFSYGEQPGWSAGDRVRVVNGKLTARA